MRKTAPHLPNPEREAVDDSDHQSYAVYSSHVFVEHRFFRTTPFIVLLQSGSILQVKTRQLMLHMNVSRNQGAKVIGMQTAIHGKVGEIEIETRIVSPDCSKCADLCRGC